MATPIDGPVNGTPFEIKEGILFDGSIDLGRVYEEPPLSIDEVYAEVEKPEDEPIQALRPDLVPLQTVSEMRAWACRRVEAGKRIAARAMRDAKKPYKDREHEEREGLIPLFVRKTTPQEAAKADEVLRQHSRRFKSNREASFSW